MAFDSIRANFDREPPEMRSRMRALGSYFLEVLRIIIISLAVIIPVRYFLVQPFYVQGASMEPNFEDHEYLIINEISYRFTDPTRGDIIVFRFPFEPSQIFIKRVIGLPGERIEIRNGNVRIANAEFPNGVQLVEPYLPPTVMTTGDRIVVLGRDEYFVLGDNRRSSFDSKDFGPIPRRLIIGRVWLRAWPFSAFRTFEAPAYDLPAHANVTSQKT